MTCAPWPIRWPTENNNEAPPDVSDALISAAKAAAQETLWGLSGRKFGDCAIIERYRMPTSGMCRMPQPYRTASGQWRNGVFGMDCCRLNLHKWPARSIISVTVDGVVQAESSYVLEGQVLRRLGTCWEGQSDCEGARIEVQYRHGEPVTDLGALAMGEMAMEYVLAFQGDIGCRLPSTVTAVTRSGVTVDLSNPAELYAEGRTGLPVSDAFIRAANPTKLVQRSAVYSPDLPSLA